MTGVGGGTFAIVCVKASWAGPQQQLLCQAYPQPGGRREPARAVEMSFFRLPSRVIMAVRTCQAWVPSECRKRVPIIKKGLVLPSAQAWRTEIENHSSSGTGGAARWYLGGA